MGTTIPIKSKRKLVEFRNYYRDVNYNPRNYALIVLGLNSALRIGDILALRWEDVYIQEKKKYREHISIIEKKTGKRIPGIFEEPIQREYGNPSDVFEQHKYTGIFLLPQGRQGGPAQKNSQLLRLQRGILGC